jgi:hypothetical protein
MLTRHSAARSAAHEGEKVEFALQAGAASPHHAGVESTPRVLSGHVVLLCGFAAQHKRLWRLALGQAHHALINPFDTYVSDMIQ